MSWFSDFTSNVWDATLGVLTGGLSVAADRLSPALQTPPANPATDPKAIEERDRIAREEALKRMMGGRESTIQTSPLGLSAAAPVATKSLLGS